jgi:hypothetical protein
MARLNTNKLITTIIVSLLVSHPQAANAQELLWRSPLSGVSTAPLDLPLNATMRGVSSSLYNTNPDELVFKIIMSNTLEKQPFSSNLRDLTIWIYWPFTGCWSDSRQNCDGLFTITAPTSPSNYPTVKSSQYVFAVKHEKVSNKNATRTDCRVPWWIDQSYYERDTLNFAVSITCLGLPKEFGFYGYSGIESQGKTIITFSDFQTTTNPFHNLASQQVQKTTTDLPLSKVCISCSGSAAKDFEEKCVEEDTNWDYSFCSSHPKTNLQVFRNKKWRTLTTINGVKDEDCGKQTPYFFEFTNDLADFSKAEKFRFYNFGNKRFKPEILNLNITS